jgi:glycogen debranching enzyme
MVEMMHKLILLLCLVALAACGDSARVQESTERPGMNLDLAEVILSDTLMDDVLQRGRAVVQTGLNAGDKYKQVWIRDLNTFIELSLEVIGPDTVKQNLRVFFETQGSDGHIVDGFIPKDGRTHKNTVETDQETSLVQSVYQYIEATGDRAFLEEKVGGKTVLERMEWAMQFLLDERWSDEYGLIWGATTADWGDVQPEHKWGVHLDENTHYALDIYDNAMFIIALQNLLDLARDDADRVARWKPTLEGVEESVRKHLWKDGRFIPHIYLADSPWPADFDESPIYYHGGTAVAIQAGLLSREEVRLSLERMRDNVRQAGAGTIGMTLYPAYPDGFFMNPQMGSYGYQNGGDWTWFGGRMIQALITYGFYQEAYDELRPMLERVRANDGFFEWYTVDNEPQGSGVFRGSAGVLAKAIYMLREEAAKGS